METLGPILIGVLLWSWIGLCLLAGLVFGGWFAMKHFGFYHWFYNLGVELAAREQYRYALMMLEQAFKIAPSYQPTMYNIGVIHIEMGNRAQAKDYLYLALLGNPEDALSAYNLGLLEYEDGHYMLAIEHWFNAIQHGETEDAEVHYCLGLAYEAMEQYEAALEVYKQGLEIEADNINCLCAAAFCYLQLGQPDECEVLLQALLAGDEVPPDALNTQALLEVERGNHEGALEIAAQAFALDRDNVDVLNTYACLLLNAAKGESDYEEAVSLLERAVEAIDEGQETCVYNLALGYALQNRKREARQLLGRAAQGELPHEVKNAMVETCTILDEMDQKRATV